ncbi:DEAD/DEAH box helicase [Halosquirtibacter xylanolyticus]|uniref:DEAD/DEAH box helicase n=1 Tax=Halosquirtibacter xylanolyticus TaxID=3374599 RepID=UPI00374857AA|nr:DEAD/DEAH box helicase [Prolixibacteraceae bacterium]
MRFDQYSLIPQIKENLSKKGLKKPTDIQFKSIPHILKGEDVLAIAQTGTGKTAAFAIPVIHKIHLLKVKKRASGIRCLVMVPTRELCMQIAEVFNDLGKKTKVVTKSIFGGVEQDAQIDTLNKGVDIVVATPGRMFDLISQGHLKLDHIEVLVLDEADQMLDKGFYHDIKSLQRHIPKRRQTLFFSATIDEKIKKLAYSLVINPIRIQISPKNPVARNVDHSIVKVKMDDKRFFLERFVKENEDKKILVFVRTKVRAERVMKAMSRVNIECLTLHGDKDQSERIQTLDKFKKGEINILVATDVSARGIDIPNVEFVINYDIPEEADNYVHRVGRTGRGRSKGKAISFVSKEENELIFAIEEYTGDKIKEIKINLDDYQDTIDYSDDVSQSWQSLIKEHDRVEGNLKKIHNKRRKQKENKKKK